MRVLYKLFFVWMSYRTMHHDRIFTTFSMIVLGLGIYLSYILSVFVRDSHYEKLENDYIRDAEFIGIVSNSRLQRSLQGTTLSLTLLPNVQSVFLH